jgi:hypothetical protein
MGDWPSFSYKEHGVPCGYDAESFGSVSFFDFGSYRFKVKVFLVELTCLAYLKAA